MIGSRLQVVQRTSPNTCHLQPATFYTNALNPVMDLPTIRELISFVPSYE